MKPLSRLTFSTAFALIFSLAPSVVSLRPVAAENDFSSIEKQIQALQPTSQEKRFDEIGWAPDIRSALNLAKQHRRPVFLFTHDGRINTGRC
jgi:hypothetical protein